MTGTDIKRILVVDDDELVRFLLRRVLGQAGFEVDVAADGKVAVEKMTARRPDLVVLDLVMPVMDGWGVLAHLRAMPEPPPVVVVSAHSERGLETRVKEEGAAAYVTKPFAVRELVATCTRVAAGLPAR